jgi:hypothetical protein
MKNNFDLKGYMKQNQVGSYQQLNEMWYQDINQALGDFNVIKEEDEMEEAAGDENLKVSIDYADYPSISDAEQKMAINQFMKLVKSLGGNATKTGDKFSTIDFEITGGPSFEELQAAYDKQGEDVFASVLASWKLNKSDLEEMEEGKKQLAFVVPTPDVYDIDDEAKHFQRMLDKAGVKAKVKANHVGEELEIYTKDEKKARKVIEKNGYQIGWNNEDNLEEMGGVKNIGDKAKMATPNARPNLGRHRSSDMLDKMSKKDHKTNTVVGAKAAAYKAPHMKEEERADDIFAGSDKANWDNYGNETSEWDTEIAGQTVKGWTAEETQGGAIAWQNPKYPNAHIYATPGWEGVDGIAFELHDSEDGYMDEPKIQKVIGSGTEAWKTKEGYMALMAKAFTVVEKMLIPSKDMAEDYMGTQYGSSEDMAADMVNKGIKEDDGTGRQINHDFNDDISIDPSEFEDTIREGIQDYNHTFEEDIMDLLDDGVSKPEILTHFKGILKNANPRMEEAIEEDEDPFGSIKTGIDKITQGDNDMDMSDDDRMMSLGGDQIKAGIESLMADGFDYREILQFVKDTIAAKRNF